MESKKNALAVPERNGLAFLDQVVGQAIDAPFGKFLATGLAGMLVAITRILELGTSNEELEDQLVGFASHCGRRMGLGGRKRERGKGEDVNVTMPKVNSDPDVNCQNVTSGQHQVEFRGQNTGFGHNTRGPKREGKIRMEEGRRGERRMEVGGGRGRS